MWTVNKQSRESTGEEYEEERNHEMQKQWEEVDLRMKADALDRDKVDLRRSEGEGMVYFAVGAVRGNGGKKPSGDPSP